MTDVFYCVGYSKSGGTHAAFAVMGTVEAAITSDDITNASEAATFSRRY